MVHLIELGDARMVCDPSISYSTRDVLVSSYDNDEQDVAVKVEKTACDNVYDFLFFFFFWFVSQ